MNIDKDEVNLELIDTCSDIQWDNINLEEIDGFIIIYCITDDGSIKEAQEIITRIKGTKPTDNILLIGNKLDLNHLRKVSMLDGKKLSESINCLFRELSVSESYSSVKEATEIIVRMIRKPLMNVTQERRLPSIATLTTVKRVIRQKIARSRSDSLSYESMNK
ncbi:DgyrCDS8419 [Dimorphilus gyrociliatus]|uniref:small monomeric GTPase n=1 Tax=Dimorphilus gyrociliatus TaxID=2664684 RepID=A0A7I8VV43_9ANNE|nr:DgyrCDS8419 [Dimorphilus gyrociliatus]